MNQGIEKDELMKDILKLDYQNTEINKELKEYCNIKKLLEKKYTSPIDQVEIDNQLQQKIDILRNNRDNDINLLKDKIILYSNVTKKTEEIFDKVKTDIIVE